MNYKKRIIFKRTDKSLVPAIFAGVVCSLMTFTADAQPAPKYSVDFSVGPSIPLGKFADKNYTAVPNANGLAKTGFSMYANMRYTFSNHIGLTLSAESSFNKQDPAAFSDYLNYGAVYPINARIVTDYWRLFKLLTGPYYQGYFSNHRLSYLISILAGASKTTVPSHSWAVYTQSGILQYEEQQSSVPLPWSFAYQAGGALQYDLKNDLYLLFSTDYFYSGSPLSVATYYLKYDFGSINIMFGTGFRF